MFGVIVTVIALFVSLEVFLGCLYLTAYWIFAFRREIILGVNISNSEINKMTVKLQYETAITNHRKIAQELCVKAYRDYLGDRMEEYSDQEFYKSIQKVIWKSENNRNKLFFRLKSENYWNILSIFEEEIYYLDCMK